MNLVAGGVAVDAATEADANLAGVESTAPVTNRSRFGPSPRNPGIPGNFEKSVQNSKALEILGILKTLGRASRMPS